MAVLKLRLHRLLNANFGTKCPLQFKSVLQQGQYRSTAASNWMSEGNLNPEPPKFRNATTHLGATTWEGLLLFKSTILSFSYC